MIDVSSLKYGVIYLVYNPRYQDDKSLFEKQLESIINRHSNYDLEFICDESSDEVYILARRFNVGNSGKEATITMSLSNSWGEANPYDIKKFVDVLSDVSSTECGNLVLEPSLRTYYDINHGSYRPSYSQQSKTKIDFTKFDINEDAVYKSLIEDKSLIIEDDTLACMPMEEQFTSHKDCAISEEEEEEKEVLSIEMQRIADLKAIQAQILNYVTTYHADPSQLMQTLLTGKIVINKENKLSPIVVNKDIKIVLQNYNEVVVEMPALCRTIYILFLNHPEGIELRNISDYREEIEDIYTVVMPGRNEEKAKQSINNLLNPFANTLNETISKIKRCFNSCIINKEIARNYYITGKRGEKYRVPLDPSLITLPRAVTRTC